MKRIRGKPVGTGKFVQVVSQVCYQRKPGYKSIGLMSIHEVVKTPSYGNNAFGKVWIVGDKGHPVVLFKHEYKDAPAPKIKRVRKEIKVKRKRLDGIKVHKRRTP